MSDLELIDEKLRRCGLSVMIEIASEAAGLPSASLGEDPSAYDDEVLWANMREIKRRLEVYEKVHGLLQEQARTP